MRGETDSSAVVACDGGKVSVTESPGAVRDGIEHGLDVHLRLADGPQDLAGRRLLLQGLGEVAVAELQLLEQAHVLEGDDRLVGECLQEGDLLIGEGPWLPAPGADGTDGDTLPEDRHGEDGAQGD